MTDSTGVVFIQGAGLDSRIWEAAAAEMACPVLLASFPEGERKSLALRDYSAHIKRQIDAWDVETFVLVAHSAGGVLALSLAAELAGRVAGFVAVGAVIPKNGGSFLSAFPLSSRLAMTLLLRVFGTRPPEAAIRRRLCSDLSGEQAAEVVRSFVPESIRLYTDRTNAALPSHMPKLYMLLEKDREISPSQQKKMAASLAPQQTATLQTGHLPMLSQPAGLSRALTAFLAGLP